MESTERNEETEPIEGEVEQPAPTRQLEHVADDVRWSPEELKKAQLQDSELALIHNLVADKAQKPKYDDISTYSRDLKHLCSFWSRFEVRDGLLCRKFEDATTQAIRWQVVLPKAFREEFLRVVHSGVTCGHLGFKKTAAAVQARAFWPSWSSDLAANLKNAKNVLNITEAL